MRLLLTTAALGALMAASSAVPASAQQAADCGKYGMTCAPMGKNLNYTTGVQAKDCGLYGMTCPKGAATAAAAPATVTPRSGITTGRSVARTRVGTRREARVRTAVAAPAATTIAAAPATTTTVRTGYGYGYGYQPQYSGYSYGYAQPATAAYGYYAPAPAAYGYYARAGGGPGRDGTVCGGHDRCTGTRRRRGSHARPDRMVQSAALGLHLRSAGSLAVVLVI